jgi:hypothetical protein
LVNRAFADATVLVEALAAVTTLRVVLTLVLLVLLAPEDCEPPP